MNNKSWSAIRLFGLLYQQVPNEPVPLSAISLQAGISVSYSEQLFRKFRQAGLVNSARGPGGGYTLARKDISVGDVMQAINNLPEHPFYDPIITALSQISFEQLAGQKKELQA